MSITRVNPADQGATTEEEEQIPVLCVEALNDAYRRALASGSPVLVSGDVPEGGRALFEVHPDGHRRRLKDLKPAVSLPVGSKVRLP